MKKKKFIITLSVLILFSCDFPVNTAMAESFGYYRIIDNDTFFFREAKTDTTLFLLPYSYYVNKIGEYGEFYHVEVFSDNLYILDGYVLKEKLFFDNLSVSSPYPEIRIKTAYTTALYVDATLSSPIQYIFKDREMNFYGEYFSSKNEKLYYVDYNGKLGYVKEEFIYPFDIPLHENPLTFIKEETPKENPSPEISEDTSYVYKIAIIGCILLAGVIGLIALISKKKREKPVIYPEETE